MQAINLEALGLSETEIVALKEMATHHKGWTYLIKLLRLWEREALQQVALFKDSNEAFERRGYCNAVTKLYATFLHLYDNRGEEQEDDGTGGSRPKQATSITTAKPRWQY